MRAQMNFSWLTPSLAACRGPQSESDLAFLRSSGIRALVRLAYERQTGMSAATVQKAELRDCYEPVEDGNAPTLPQIEHVLRFVLASLRQQIPVAISCYAGQGRTGVLAACYFVLCGDSAEQAIERVIRLHPTAREVLGNSKQMKVIRDFANRVRLGHVTI
jgi:atypical dual specificity phosphatase